MVFTIRNGSATMTIHYATALTLDALTLEVDDLISKGYTPLGSVVLNPSHHSERFIQTMTRREHAIELKPLQSHTASEAPKRKYVRRKPVASPTNTQEGQ